MRRRAPTLPEIDIALAVPLLQPIDAHRLARLAGRSGLLDFDEDAHLFAAGDSADRFYVVIDGSVRLYAVLPNGRETTIAIVNAPASFGEAAMFASGSFPLNASATAGSRIMQIEGGAFLAELEAHPELGLRMLGSMRKWEERLLDELRHAKLLSPVQRIAGYFLSLCGVDTGAATIQLPYGKGLLADVLGIKPETFSRNMQRLSLAGVSSRGNRIHISDVERLRRVFRGDSVEKPRSVDLARGNIAGS